MASGSGPEAVKQDKIKMFRSNILHRWDDILMLMSCALFAPFMRILPEQNIFPVVCRFAKVLFGKLHVYSNVYFGEQLLPWTLCLFKGLHMADSRTGMFADSSDVFKPLAFTHGFFFTSLRILRCALEVIFVGSPFLGRVATVPICQKVSLKANSFYFEPSCSKNPFVLGAPCIEATMLLILKSK